MNILKYKILEEKNVIDDHLLDIIGNDFKFDHEKGLAEWLKNSVDAYIRAGVADSEQFVILRFSDSAENAAAIDCIDFVGMSSVDIDKALKRWGDPEAAKRGLKKKTYGGHGNGGKFYMRQMFKRSHFITYKNGLLNIFGFNEDKKYGFAEKYKDRKASYLEALEVAGLKEKDIPKIYLEKIKNNNCGFTVVKGVSPSGMPNKIKVSRICDKLKKHPQSMRIMERMNVMVFYNGQMLFENMKPEQIKPLAGFDVPTVLEIPEKINYQDHGDVNVVVLSNKKYSPGRLILKTSEIALSSNSKYSDLNRIDIIGELGVVASYPLREFGLYFPQTDFIYGECECPILEDPDDDCVSNDRARLSENAKSKALLQWIKEKIEDECKQISVKEEKERNEISKKVSSDFNNFLDQWKNNFMSKILSEIFVGAGPNSGGGYEGSGTQGGRNGEGNDNSNSNNIESERDGNQGGSGTNPQKGKKFPRVLLSGSDEDPLNPGNVLTLQPGHGLVYQRAQDVTGGIYWINTTSPLAEAILKRYDANSSRWREYLFQRYVDIFMKEALINLEKREPDRFNSSTIDGEIFSKVVSKIHEVAAKDLDSFLFDDRYELKQ